MDQSGLASSPEESTNSSQFFVWIATFIPKRGEEGTRCFDAAYVTPPISVNTLADLNIGSIISSFRARHDLNFELETTFRPSFNRERAQVHQKVQQAQDYWWALETELEIYDFLLSRNPESDFRWTPLWLEEFRKRQKRVPKAFEAIQNILLAMVPPDGQSEVQEMFDVRFIVKQIEGGSLDLASLATWLSELLKTYCAPLRDSWVDQICRQLGLGMQDFDARIVVRGLRMLFGLFEAMKLVSCWFKL